MDRPSKVIKVGDRDILFQGLGEGQYMQMVHEGSLFNNPNTNNDRKMKGLDRLYRTMLSLVVNGDDRDYLEDQMADGAIDMMFLVHALREIYNKPPLNSALPEQKVRRGRPRKTA